MDVNEFIGLAKWMNDRVNPAMSLYEQLAKSMEQNTSNGSKVPLREHLDAVQNALLKMPLSQLSYQQTDLLDEMEVGDLLGAKGWRFVERTVKEGNYDPASAATDIRKAKQRLDSALQQFKKIRLSLSEVGIKGEPDYETSDKVTVRVRFKDAVEIGNVTQLKKWSTEWYDISRGLAMAAGERPEDVEVKGASTGSLILILGTTLSVASIIALIMKQIASTVKSSMEIAHTLQDWKMRKVADAEVERVLLARRKSVEDGGVQDALELVREKIGERIAGDVENALKKSIEKMFRFTSKGGELDMLPPPKPADDEELDDTVAEAINTITENVEEMRTLKAATQLLIEDQANDAPDKEADDAEAGE
ncbi:hypothetical protein KM176_06445 [Pseudooceanicola sp. CBS1P-1]|uniref:Uncharacterized protein n=1 Tax=Pseudooceanicola albus TaxID=2692189 RepID=A0A6L7G1Q4_9RHOB|nr:MULTISPECIES: hypothetical protein [Pseudooceanicola]MBT9383491.1 hypothetical protein [Pseudooceanicola endophyticus]MXN17347.1 hypothetical protein [Pseudooceanicola albus]